MPQKIAITADLENDDHEILVGALFSEPNFVNWSIKNLDWTNTNVDLIINKLGFGQNWRVHLQVGQ